MQPLITDLYLNIHPCHSQTCADADACQLISVDADADAKSEDVDVKMSASAHLWPRHPKGIQMYYQNLILVTTAL